MTSTSGRSDLSRRGLLGVGVLAGAGALVMPAAAAHAGPAAQPPRARATWPGELGSLAFGPVPSRNPTAVPVSSSSFEVARTWSFDGAPGATGGIEKTVGRDLTFGGVVRVRAGSPAAWPRLKQWMTAPPAAAVLRLRGWTRTERVVGGHGAYLSIEFYDKNNKRLGFGQGIGVTGTQGWTRLSAVATVPRNATRMSVNCLLNGTGTAYFDHISLQRVHLLVPAHSPTVDLTVRDTAVVPGLLGMGLQDNGHAWASYGRMTRPQRDLITERLAWMRPSWLRTFVDRSWWERRPGDYRFDGAEIGGVAAAMAAYAAVGARINVVMWRPTDWRPADTARLADCFDALLGWVRGRGLQVDAVTFVNEPDREYTGSSDDYLAVLQGLRQRLHRAGWSGVDVVGGDVAASPQFYSAAVSDPTRSSDMLSFHTYVAHEESLHAPLYRAQEFVDMSGSSTSRPPIMLWESNATSRTGRHAFSPGRAKDGRLTVERYPSMLTWTSYALQALATGVQGICYWETMDSFYQGNRGYLMEFGLWEGTHRDVALRHSYHLFGLLSRYIQPGADLISIQADRRAALVTAAVRNPDGSRALYLLNPWPDPTTAALTLPGWESQLREHRWTRATADQVVRRQQAVLRGSVVRLAGGRTLRTSVPGESLVVLVSEPAGSATATPAPLAR